MDKMLELLTKLDAAKYSKEALASRAGIAYRPKTSLFDQSSLSIGFGDLSDEEESQLAGAML